MVLSSKATVKRKRVRENVLPSIRDVQFRELKLQKTKIDMHDKVRERLGYSKDGREYIELSDEESGSSVSEYDDDNDDGDDDN